MQPKATESSVLSEQLSHGLPYSRVSCGTIRTPTFLISTARFCAAATAFTWIPLPPAFKAITGFEVTLAGIVLQGSTDTGILREACNQAGIPPEVLEAHTDAILEAMGKSVAEQSHAMDLVRMPGVEEALRHLAQRGALLGVATGNLEMIGWIKVETAGLREWFRFGGFSDHFPVRSELIAHAAGKAREMAGADARVCVVGDTPRDIEAARANSLPVIAVATGRYSFDELFALRPEVCATTLADLLAFTGAAA